MIKELKEEMTPGIGDARSAIPIVGKDAGAMNHMPNTVGAWDIVASPAAIQAADWLPESKNFPHFCT